MGHSAWKLILKLALPIAAMLAFPHVGCIQPSAAPTSAPAAAKAAPSKEAKPQAKDVKPEAKAAQAQKEPLKAERKLARLKVAYASMGALMSPLWLTKEKGLFEKYGLDVELQYIATSTTVVQSLLAGELNLALLGGGAVVNADLAGADLVLIAATNNLLLFSLYGQPSIMRVEDLKGKAVGASGRGSSTDFAARYTLQKFGLEPEKDVAVVQTGGVPETLAALQAGGIQAGVISAPSTLKAKQLGMREVINIFDLKIPYMDTGFTVRKSYLAGNEETVRSFMKAFVEGIAVTKKDKEFAKKVIGQYTKTDDKEILEETYESYLSKALPSAPYVAVEAMKTVVEGEALSNDKAKDAKPETFIDNRLVKELDDSGFIKKLYGN